VEPKLKVPEHICNAGVTAVAGEGMKKFGNNVGIRKKK
jgi:hypothetical protein